VYTEQLETLQLDATMALQTQDATSGASVEPGGKITLTPGDKYNLAGPVHSDEAPRPYSISVHYEDCTWGRGGVNAVRYIRALAPDPGNVPIMYTDVAMNPPLLESVRKDFNDPKSNVIELLARNSADRYLEVYLSSLGVEPRLYYPKKPEYRRIWVFRRVRGTAAEIDTKIICRGLTAPNPGMSPASIMEQVRSGLDRNSIGVILFNSLKDQVLFDTAYDLYKTWGDIPGVFVMTEGMQKIATNLIKDPGNGRCLPPCILMFNEDEFCKLAHTFGYRGRLRRLYEIARRCSGNSKICPCRPGHPGSRPSHGHAGVVCDTGGARLPGRRG
jgi:hypothetical protein